MKKNIIIGIAIAIPIFLVLSLGFIYKPKDLSKSEYLNQEYYGDDYFAIISNKIISIVKKDYEFTVDKKQVDWADYTKGKAQIKYIVENSKIVKQRISVKYNDDYIAKHGCAATGTTLDFLNDFLKNGFHGLNLYEMVIQEQKQKGLDDLSRKSDPAEYEKIKTTIYRDYKLHTGGSKRYYIEFHMIADTGKDFKYCSIDCDVSED